MTSAQRVLPKEIVELSAAATLEDLTRAADTLMSELELGGYKFCVASARASRLIVLAVISGGDLAVAEAVLSGKLLSDPEDPLARTYWTQQPVLWSAHLSEAGPRTESRSQLEALGVSCGASIPVISRSGQKRASLCVSGAPDEAPEAFDERFPQMAQTLRLSGLIMFEFGLELARQRAAVALSPSEAHVLELLAAGYRPREIAEAMSKSESTVRNQIASARERLGADSALQAVAIWNMRAP